VIAVGIVAHHLISFAREACEGRQNASFYSRRVATWGESAIAPAPEEHAHAA
jgi:hypothetical protein